MRLRASSPSLSGPYGRTFGVSENSRERLEGWLRYADDLGLAPFFRDRINTSAGTADVSITALPIQNLVATSGAAIVDPMPKPKQNLSSNSTRTATAINAAPKAFVPPAKAAFVP